MSPFTPSLLPALLLPELAHDGVGCPPCNNPDMRMKMYTVDILGNGNPLLHLEMIPSARHNAC